MTAFKTLPFLVLIASAGCTQPPATSTPTASAVATEVKATAPDAQSKMERGYALPGLGHGLCQSPINIDTVSLKADKKHRITVNFKDEVNKIENLGHTVQLDFKEGSSITADGMTFEFTQCHFHTPSEHLIDSVTYPMEMHIVNVAPATPSQKTPEYLVIGVLFKEGKENKFIAEFLKSVPGQSHTSGDLKVGKVKLADLFAAAPPSKRRNHYFYKGSLTTPPYTESVRWHIAEHIYEASAAQLEALDKIEGNNARHVQALYGRSLLEE